MALRRDDSCSMCGESLPAGTRAQWDSTAKQVTCLPCVDSAAGGQGEGPSAPTAAHETTAHEETPPSVDQAAAAVIPERLEPESPKETHEPAEIASGVAGASARHEYERRQKKRERQLEEKWGTGRIGKIAKFLSDDPQSTKAWDKGAVGEERLAKILHEKLDGTAVLLHDRKVPGTKGNIDHLAIAASGVWIIDAKRYKGKVERRDVGGFFKSDWRLYVGGRDRTKAVSGLQWQLDAVSKALGDDEVPVNCALSFVDAEWPLLFAKPFQVEDVWISWPSKLAELISAEGTLTEDEVEAVARLLSEKLPGYSG